MSTAFPEMHKWYGMLSGLIYDVPFSIFGLASGYICNSPNRTLLIGLVMIAQSVTHVVTGTTSIFSVIVFMRLLHAITSSSQEPLCFSLMASKARPEDRSSVNAILDASSWIGCAFNSFVILLIN